MPEPPYLAFDIETVKIFPDGEDWRDHRPLGIACAAAYAAHLPTPVTWYTSDQAGIADQMSVQDLQTMVAQLCDIVRRGFTIVTWNGMGFDWDVLAEESGMLLECRKLALEHIDMMFQVFMHKGYPIALATAAEGMNTPGKTEGMDGALALQMWAEGNREPVVDYCSQDVVATHDLAMAAHTRKVLHWKSKSGRPQTMMLQNSWAAVEQAMRSPMPNQSWMTDPITLEHFTSWLHDPKPTAN